MRRMVFVPLLIFIALAAIGGGIFYWAYNNYLYYQTDDAQVSGHIVNVSSPMAGKLTTLSVKQGDTVSAGQTIGTITPVSTGAPGAAASIDLSSPISGTILQTAAVQNQTVAPGLSIVQVTDLSALSVTAYVDESAISNVKVGQDVDIHVDAYGDTSFTGHVKQIIQSTQGEFSLLPTQDVASGNFTKVGQRVPVIITLEGNGGKDLVPGLSAEVSIHIH